MFKLSNLSRSSSIEVMSSERSYVIIGAGVFGASTAYHLIRKYPGAKITLVDRTPYPCPMAASWDWNKIVRADYDDLFYMAKSLEAIQEWRTHPLFAPFYHESGIVKIDSTGMGRRMIDKYKMLGVEVDAEMVPPEQFKRLYSGFYQNADLQDVQEVFVNRDSGWVEAVKALTAVTDAAIKAGVKYVEADIQTLTFDETGNVTGARTMTGEVLSGDRIILCTGAGTAKLLADSAPNRPELQVNDRMVAAAVVTGIVNLDSEEGRQYSELPAIVHAFKTTQGGMMPLTAPLSEGGPYTIKFSRDESFKNTCRHELSGQFLSMPPSTDDRDQNVLTNKLMARLETVKNGILGELGKKVKIDEYRTCWDAITPNQDFIIASHPYCEGLYVATAGSFHGWKFLPILGRYVVELLDDELDAELVKRWAWDRENKGSAHGKLLPKLELKDL